MTKLHRTVARICAAALLTAGVAVVASAPATAAGDTSDITVYLAPPDPAGLASLAHATDLTHAERIAQLDQLLPDPAPVVGKLRALGLTVTGEDPWSVSAQAPASLVDQLFGTRPTLTSLLTATVAQLRAATASLPLLPATLDGLVTAVMPAGGPAVQQAHATSGGVTYSGAQIRSAYGESYDGSSAAPPQYSRGTTPTVASIQFSTDPTLMSDLAHVGTVRSGQIQQVTVSDPNDTSGADEVALDQEALLSVAPGVNQRIYYAANTPDMGAAYQAVLNDVRGGRSDIVALTTSWGRCESSVDTSVTNAMEPILMSLVASGVTVFAASGDSGIYDCNTPPSATLCPVVCPAPTVDVDYPASSPSVVAVGATKLTSATGPETAWSCTGGAGSSLLSTLGDCYAPPAGTGGGSGGGASTRFAMPSWQKSNLSPTYAASSQRLVPDIAAIGDPSTGFNAFVNGTAETLGGTSLSTPVSAGLLAAMLGHYNVPSGIGDVHATLYKVLGKGNAPIYGRDVTSDVTPGTNGANADKSANDPSVAATLGYDTVTGLGSVFWDNFKFNLLPNAPTIAASMRQSGGNVVANWSVATAPVSSALSSISVNIISNGATVFSETNPLPSAAATFPGTPGASYTMVVTASDLVGHPGAGATSTTRFSMPVTAPSGTGTVTGSGTTNIDDVLLKGSGWKRVKTKHAFGGKVLTTSSRGRKVSIKVTAQTITLSFFAGPARGRLTVLVDGKKHVIDEYSKHTVRKSVTLLVAPRAGTHTLQFAASGTHNRHSKGNAVDIDFLTAYLP